MSAKIVKGQCHAMSFNIFIQMELIFLKINSIFLPIDHLIIGINAQQHEAQVKSSHNEMIRCVHL